jgi:hypothetical protein
MPFCAPLLDGGWAQHRVVQSDGSAAQTPVAPPPSAHERRIRTLAAKAHRQPPPLSELLGCPRKPESRRYGHLSLKEWLT